MSKLRLKLPESYSVQNIYTDLHVLLLQSKLSHYITKSFAQHEAFGRTYDSIADLVDTMTEKLIGYSNIDPIALNIGKVEALQPKVLANSIIQCAARIESFAEEKEYCDIENLAQELSGIGAQLSYLSRFN